MTRRPALRPLGFAGALVAGLLALATVAWHDAGERRYAVLEEEADALLASAAGSARSALDAVARSEAALADRLSAAARRLDRAVAAEPARADALARAAAAEERIARAWVLDADLRIVASGRWPERPAVSLPSPTAITPERAEALERERLEAEARSASFPAGQDLVVEGLQSNPFGTRTRLGVVLRRADGGRVVLRADADALEAERRSYGLEAVLDHLVRAPGVLGAWVEPTDASTVVGTRPSRSDGLLRRSELDLGDGTRPMLGLLLSTDAADAAVARSRRAIAFGTAAAALLALGASLLLARAERRHREREAAIEARRLEDRRLADLGALAGAVAHEVRNPLNAFRLAAGLLRSPSGPDSAEAVASTLEGEVRRLDATIEAFLALARGAGPRRRSVHLVDVAEAAAARVSEAARAAGVPVEVREDAPLPAQPLDPDLIEQAVTALLRNAIEASPRGTPVDLRVGRDGPSTVALTVEDRGPGIPAEMRARLFHLGATGRPGGHGLGLALALRFVEAHGGTIVHEDVEPTGARFVLRLPDGTA